MSRYVVDSSGSFESFAEEFLTFLCKADSGSAPRFVYLTTSSTTYVISCLPKMLSWALAVVIAHRESDNESYPIQSYPL